MQGRTALDVKAVKVEKARRLVEEGLRFYKPHSGQLAFHKSRAQKRGLFWPNQAGKSYAGAMEMGWAIGGVHPFRPNYSGAVFARDCCESDDVLHATLIPAYRSILPRNACRLGGVRYFMDGAEVIVPGTTFEGTPRVWPGLEGGSWDTAFDKQRSILHLANGSFVEFKTYRQDVQTYAGPPRHIIRHDEEPPEAVYRENQARQITVGVNMIFTMTPLNYSRWIYADLYEKSFVDDRIDAFTMPENLNPYADKEALQALADDITDPAERAARLRGEFTYIEGRVWKDYGDHNLCDEFVVPGDWHKSVVIDPHEQKPTAVNWFAENDSGKIFCYREASLRGDVEYICTQIRVESRGENIKMWLIDPSSRRAASIRGKGRMIDEFRKYIPYIIEADNDAAVGRTRVAKYVKNCPVNGPRYFNMRCCPMTHHQMKNYSWKPPTKTGEDRMKPEVVKRDDDHCDNVRYRIMADFDVDGEGITSFGMGVYGNG